MIVVLRFDFMLNRRARMRWEDNSYLLGVYGNCGQVYDRILLCQVHVCGFESHLSVSERGRSLYTASMVASDCISFYPLQISYRSRNVGCFSCFQLFVFRDIRILHRAPPESLQYMNCLWVLSRLSQFRKLDSIDMLIEFEIGSNCTFH